MLTIITCGNDGRHQARRKLGPACGYKKVHHMRLLIHDNLTVAQIQERFQEAFPNLKLEFYSRPHVFHQGSRLEDLIDPSKKIGEIRNSKEEEEEISVFSKNTVGEFEQRLRKDFGLNIQVFRRETGCWVQTIATDAYTLGEQNAMVQPHEKEVYPKNGIPVVD
jgi:hypothetical protein